MRSIELDILLTLAAGERHGYAIIQEIETRGGTAVTVETGTLYRALQRLVEADLVRPAGTHAVRAGDEGRRRLYSITAAGRVAGAAEARRLAALVHTARTVGLITEGA